METGLKVGVEESPESSWSENTTPGCDDIEEVVRQQQYRTHLPTKGSRFMRPAIRRRLNIAEKVDRGHNITKAFTITTIDTARSMDGSDASSNSTFTLVTSAPSSCADPWSPPGLVEEEADMLENMIGDDNDDEILVPKLEPIDDDDVDMMDVKESSIAPEMSSSSTSPVTTKRPRGRPRKHPKANPDSVMKLSKGRSKTGCITCRKRKKKCDEAKPGCMNCEKNSVKCEGYPQKTIWKSGKEKAEEARLRRNSVMLKIKLQPVIPGVETASDKMFFEHYIFRLSGILTVETDRNHSFKDMLLQYAVKHVGLMHSILALSSKHIDFRSPYGVKFLREHPDTDIKTLEARSQFHHERAMSELNKFIERQNNEDAADESNVAIPAIYGQMICLVLETLADPNPTGQHRIHLQAYSSLIKQYPPADRDFLRFIQEFFQYHISADELICLPEGRARLGTVSDDWNLPHAFVHPESVRLLGVSDGLFLYMSKITNIRNKIRENIRNDIDPVVDYTSLYRAAEIDAGIREWTPSWPAGDSRDLAGLLYKQMMWIYLWRTIYPPRTTSWNPDPKIVQAVDDGIELLTQFKPSDPSQTLILAPAFVIGCAAFEDRQREPIRKAISVVKEYMQYKNSDSVLKVLEEVWRLMDAESEESWDWQMVAHRIGIDFLAT